MVKFILIVIIIGFVGLVYYVNIGKDDSNVKPVVKKEESTLSVEEPLREIKKDVTKDTTIEKKQAVKVNAIQKSTKTVEKNVVTSDGETNEDLTLESIENADVSDEEKERLLDSMAYQQGLHMKKLKPLTDEEAKSLIEQGVKDGIL